MIRNVTPYLTVILKIEFMNVKFIIFFSDNKLQHLGSTTDNNSRWTTGEDMSHSILDPRTHTGHRRDHLPRSFQRRMLALSELLHHLRRVRFAVPH